MLELQTVSLPVATTLRRMWFTPDPANPADGADTVTSAILTEIAAAVASIHLLVYSFTSSEIADMLIAKHRSGVTVEVIMCRTQARGKTQRVLVERMRAAGIGVMLASSPKSSIMHHKAVIIDYLWGGPTLIGTGSFNLTTDAPRQANFWMHDYDKEVVRAFWEQYALLKQYVLAKGLKQTL